MRETITLFALIAAAAADAAGPVSRLTGADQRGRPWAWRAAPDGRPLAVVFLGTECPMVLSYAGKLQALADRCAGKADLVGVMSNHQDDAAEVRDFVRRAKIRFPVVLDPEQKIADRFGATRTPEAFVLDGRGFVRYHGRIDDRFDRGKRKGAATRLDLREAIAEVAAGKAVTVPQTAFTGCLIGRKPKRVAPKRATPVYSRDVAPVLFKRCASCHRDGQVAPFSMRDAGEVASWAPTIGEAVREKRMPPWSADTKPGHFSNDISLTAAERRTVLAWADAGGPIDAATKNLKFPERKGGWKLGEPDLVVTLPGVTIPPGDEDIWPTLTATVPLKDGDYWVRAIEVLPGNPKVMHHLGLSFGNVSVMGEAGGAPAAGGRAAPARRFGRFGGGRGRMFRRGGPPGDSGKNGSLGAWAAGTPAFEYPDGMGTPLSPTDGKITFRAGMHYHPDPNTVQKDQTRIGVYFGKGELKKVVKRAAASYLPIVLKPGVRNYEVRARHKLYQDVYVIDYGPHMHFRGSDVTYTAVYPNGKRETLIDVPRYDFNYQWVYTLAKPKFLPAGTAIEAVGHMDNSEDNPNNPDPSATVRFGPESDDEMFSAIFHYVPAEGKAAGRGDPGRPVREWLAESHTGQVYAGTVGLMRGFINLPAAVRLTRDGRGELILPGNGSVFALDLGPTRRGGRRVTADFDNGYGRTTLDGTLAGGELRGKFRVENDLKNPYLRMWNRGFEFRGSLRR